MTEKNPVRVIARAFSILFLLAKEGRPLGITEIATEVSLPKATVYRILDSLVAERAVKTQDGYYKIGPASLFFAASYRRQVGFAEAAQNHLLALRNATEETVHLFVYEKGDFSYFDKIESPYQVRMHSRIGGEASLIKLSAGKAVLANLPEEELKTLHEEISSEVRSQFPLILNRGFAIDDEENELGLRCVGAAILDVKGHPIGAISVSAPVYRLTEEKIEPYGALVRSAAQAISAEVRLEEEHPFGIR